MVEKGQTRELKSWILWRQSKHILGADEDLVVTLPVRSKALSSWGQCEAEQKVCKQIEDRTIIHQDSERNGHSQGCWSSWEDAHHLMYVEKPLIKRQMPGGSGNCFASGYLGECAVAEQCCLGINVDDWWEHAVVWRQAWDGRCSVSGVGGVRVFFIWDDWGERETACQMQLLFVLEVEGNIEVKLCTLENLVPNSDQGPHWVLR